MFHGLLTDDVTLRPSPQLCSARFFLTTRNFRCLLRTKVLQNSSHFVVEKLYVIYKITCIGYIHVKFMKRKSNVTHYFSKKYGRLAFDKIMKTLHDTPKEFQKYRSSFRTLLRAEIKIYNLKRDLHPGVTRRISSRHLSK